MTRGACPAPRTAKTQSETLLEKFCMESQIRITPIPTEETQTPDYEMILEGQKIIVEVKETRPNRHEQESERLRRESRWEKVLSRTPGDRVRKMIEDSLHQIKTRTEKIYPSILVLFDRGAVADHLDPYNIRVAMRGLEQLHIAVPRDRSVSPYITRISYGPKRKMTQECNTSISAIGVLITPGPDEIRLHVYHNQFAAVPLDPRLLAKHNIPQFKLEAESPGITAKWEKIVCS